MAYQSEAQLEDNLIKKLNALNYTFVKLDDYDALEKNFREQISIFNTYNRELKMDILSQKIRFKDNIGNEFPDWKEKNLIEVCSFINGKAHENVIEEKGTYIVVNSKFISSDELLKSIQILRSFHYIKMIL